MSDVSNQKALQKACATHDLEAIRQALNDGATAKDLDDEGLSVLHLALQTPHELAKAMIQLLIEHHADVNAVSPNGDSILHLVASWSNELLGEQVSILLLENGADIDIRNASLRRAYDIAVNNDLCHLANLLLDQSSQTAAIEKNKQRIRDHYSVKLIEAVIKGDSDGIVKSIEEGADPNIVNSYGNAALHYAITHCPLMALDVVEMLINAGADVNLKNNECDTALNLTIKSTKLREDGSMYKLAEYLLQNGASCDIRDLDDADAVTLSQNRNYDDVTALLLKGPMPQEEDICDVVAHGSAAAVLRLLKAATVDVNATNADGYSVIHLVVLREDEEEKETILKRVLSKGAGINTKTKQEGDTALHVLIKSLSSRSSAGICDFVTLLLNLHIDKDSRNNEGKTGYDLAKERDYRDIMDLLQPNITPDSNCNSKNNTEMQLHKAIGNCSFHDVVECSNTENIAAEITRQGEDGSYPIHTATRRTSKTDKESIIKFIILLGADINAVHGVTGDTALHNAVQQNDLATVQLLLENGCDFSKVNRAGDSAHNVAMTMGYDDIAAVLSRENAKKNWQRGTKKAKLCSIS